MNVSDKFHWPQNLGDLGVDSAGVKAIDQAINENFIKSKENNVKIIAHVPVQGHLEDRNITIYKGGNSIVVDFGKNGLYDVVVGKKIELKLPESPQELYRDLGISKPQADILKNFIKEKYLQDQGTNKSYAQGQKLTDAKELPRPVTFHEGGKITITLLGGEKGCTFTEGDLYDVTSGQKISKDDLKQVEKKQTEAIFPKDKDVLYRELGISPDDADLLKEFIEKAPLQYRGSGKTYQDADAKRSDGKWLPRPVTFHKDGRITIDLKGVSHTPGNHYDPILGKKDAGESKSPIVQSPIAQSSSNLKQIEAKFSKNIDDLYNKMGLTNVDSLKRSIEEKYTENAYSGKQLKLSELPVTFLKNGEVIIELEKEHLKDENLVYEALSGKRYKTEEMSKENFAKLFEKSKSMDVLDRPVFHYEMKNKNGNDVIRVLYNEELNKSIETSKVETKQGTWTNVALPHKYLYGVQGNPQKGPPYQVKIPKEAPNWTQKNNVGESEKGPNKVFRLDANNNTTFSIEGTKTFDRTTSELFKSDFIKNVSGLQFTGSIKKEKGQGDYLNHIAVFFHSDEFYNAGYEYGFAFREGTNTLQFYIEGDANIYDVINKEGITDKNPNHIWNDWPKMHDSGGGFTVADSGLADALKDLEKESTWSINVLKNGDFHLQITDIETGKISECTIKKPEKFPNLHGADGYLTVNAQKFRPSDNVTTPAELNIKEIKAWKSDI